MSELAGELVCSRFFTSRGIQHDARAIDSLADRTNRTRMRLLLELRLHGSEFGRCRDRLQS